MDKKRTGVIYGVNGPVIYLQGKSDFKMSEMVYVGEQRLVGEVIALDKDRTTIQVYEETSGLRPGEIVEATGAPVSVTLAPGILDNIFDGIERPLERIADKGGAFITRGVAVDSLDKEKKWQTHLTVKEGDVVHGGSVIAEVPETRAIVHKCMVPPEVEVAKVVEVVPDGEYTINDVLVKIQRSHPARLQMRLQMQMDSLHQAPLQIPECSLYYKRITPESSCRKLYSEPDKPVRLQNTPGSCSYL